jgi:hypothetical protein
MKRILFASAVLAVLAGCSSTPTDPYEKRAAENRERQEKLVNKIVDQAPDWFTKVPVSKDAVYAVGDAYGGTMSGALDNARASAYFGICQAAGGTVRGQTKVYRKDTETASAGVTTTAIRNMCPDVDVTGADVTQQKVITANGRFHAYVLVGLPLGDANVLARTKQRDKLQLRTVDEASREFKDLDTAAKKVE